ncbi:MAG TPA: hypothetical protein DCY06_05535 [Bacteroidetes bacterium]|nr:hypothetical protein [Bacteroidota bacterium]
MNFSFDYSNNGYKYIFGTIVNLYSKSVSDSNLISTDTVKTILKTDSVLTYSNSFNKPDFRDSARVFVVIKPVNDQNEFYYFNNDADIPLTASSSNVKNDITISADGKVIYDGETVRKNPDLRIELSRERNYTEMNDTSLISLRLNGIHIPYRSKGNLNPVLKVMESDNQNSSGIFSLLLNAELNKGSNRLSISYLNSDGNSDSLSMELLVSDETGITGLYNYPNPMRSETSFMFDIISPDVIPSVRIKIYTVHGRLIKEIFTQPSFGSNQIFWDGKDNDGDFVANGTYLYKLFTDGNNKTETPVQKLVVLK